MSAVASEEENAGELQFGKEFVDEVEVQCLTNDEVFFLLSKRSLTGGILTE
jgi:hypothetical protein